MSGMTSRIPRSGYTRKIWLRSDPTPLSYAGARFRRCIISGTLWCERRKSRSTRNHDSSAVFEFEFLRGSPKIAEFQIHAIDGWQRGEGEQWQHQSVSGGPAFPFHHPSGDPTQLLSFVNASSRLTNVRRYRSAPDAERRRSGKFIQVIEYEAPESMEINRQRIASDVRLQPICRPGAPCAGGVESTYSRMWA